ncbi:MAG: phasin family protein [Hyphomicrobiaceae bacterium]
MAEKSPFEIPDTVRDLAERNVEQARNAYSQFMTMARQAQEMMTKSSPLMTESAREVQERAFRYAQDNIDASFNFAADLARARDVNEYLQIQTRYAQAQMKSYADQAQDLGRLMAEAAQKTQRRD